MSMNDPIADMLTRVRNANIARHDTVLIPSSKMKVAIAKVLKDEGFIRDYKVEEDGTAQTKLKVELGYGGRRQPVLSGLQRVSKPGLRVYVHRNEIPRVYGGLGIAILSTPKGVMTGQEARRQSVGGELLCYVW
ncbi:MAG: 30S ribosomal protein S8 [Dehalococcoidia bacterium]|nr:30S ribosomal protein S8 [Dehalococcoidia bacterium]